MSPLLTTYANGSARGYGAFSVAAAAGSFESIATVTVGSGGAASVAFTSIAGTYTHLQIRMLARSNRVSTGDWAKVRFNSDSGSNYSYHDIYAEGTGSATSYGSANESSINVDSLTAQNSTANLFGAFVLDILDYANVNKYKTTRYLGGHDANGSGVVNFGSGNWRSTSAITSIQITPGLGTGFAQYSSFALYGIKGA
jgi:hypothetical protein